MSVNIFSIATLSIDFIAFERAGESKHLTLFAQGMVDGLPGDIDIVELVQDTVRSIMEKQHERGISLIHVYDVWFSKVPRDERD